MSRLLNPETLSKITRMLTSTNSQTIMNAISFSLTPAGQWDLPTPTVQQIIEWIRPTPYFSHLAPGVRCYVIKEDLVVPQSLDEHPSFKWLDPESVTFYNYDDGKAAFALENPDVEFVDYVLGRHGNEEVLIKRFHQGDAGAILREAVILTRLAAAKMAPQLLGVLPGEGATWDMPALVMAHLPSVQPLGHFLLDQRPLTRLEALHLCRDLVNVVRAMHQRDVLLNELHISQLAVVEDHTSRSPIEPLIQIMDLGETTFATGICFSIPYSGRHLYTHLAPEVLREERTRKSSDIYSLGVVLRAIMAAHALEKELFLLIGWCCQDNPVDRPTIDSVYVYIGMLCDLQQKKGDESMSCADIVDLDVCNRCLNTCMEKPAILEL